MGQTLHLKRSPTIGRSWQPSHQTPGWTPGGHDSSAADAEDAEAAEAAEEADEAEDDEDEDDNGHEDAED